MWYTVPRIPLIEDLTKGPISPGSALLVEFDAASQWYAGSVAIAAGWLRTGGRVLYGVTSQSPSKFRLKLSRQGLNTEELERNDRLRIFDWYSATLGRKSEEKFPVDSLKVADLSIWWSKARLSGPPETENLGIVDDLSILDRFNDEKNWVEFVLTRIVPTTQMRKETGIRGVMNGVCKDSVYRRLEGGHDGIIDVRLDESGESPANLVRVRVMRDVDVDGRWHQFKVNPNNVSLQKIARSSPAS